MGKLQNEERKVKLHDRYNKRQRQIMRSTQQKLLAENSSAGDDINDLVLPNPTSSMTLASSAIEHNTVGQQQHQQL